MSLELRIKGREGDEDLKTYFCRRGESLRMDSEGESTFCSVSLHSAHADFPRLINPFRVSYAGTQRMMVKGGITYYYYY